MKAKPAVSRVPLLGVCLAIAVHALSFVLMWKEVEPFYSFFYSFAWWSYILAIGSCNQLLGSNSVIYRGLRPVLGLALSSSLGWLTFEALNFRLVNWHYAGVPEEIWIRWPGYLIAFSTVFPGLFETETLLRNLGLGALPGYRWKVPGSKVMFVLGLAMLGLTLVQPRIFFPLAWLALIFLLEPVLARMTGGESLFGGSAPRNKGLITRLLLAGLICGILWEFWNFWAGSKWHYTIPYFDFGRIFEMPLMGYLGFPPFALECYLINRILNESSCRLQRSTGSWKAVAAFGSALFIVIVLSGIDRWTVFSYRPVLP